MGRSEPGGEKERELARMATMVIAAGRREGRQANDWRTFNEKSSKQAKTVLFIQNLFETEHPEEYERTGIFILESRRDLGRDGPSENKNEYKLWKNRTEILQFIYILVKGNSILSSGGRSLG